MSHTPRIGIYGGTFDPVHLGHLVLAEACREQCQLERVLFVPAAVPPHKQGLPITASRERVDMLEFALAGCPEFSISRIELDRPGPSYTVDTLQSLKVEHPEAELHLLLGADSVVDFPTWRQPEAIAALATLVIVNRGRMLPDLSRIERLVAEAGGTIRVVSMPAIDISASDLRHRVHSGQSLRFLVPRPVAIYIEQRKLYQP